MAAAIYNTSSPHTPHTPSHRSPELEFVAAKDIAIYYRWRLVLVAAAPCCSRRRCSSPRRPPQVSPALDPSLSLSLSLFAPASSCRAGLRSMRRPDRRGSRLTFTSCDHEIWAMRSPPDCVGGSSSVCRWLFFFLNSDSFHQ